MKLSFLLVAISSFVQCGYCIEWEPLGCYKDSSDRAMGHYFGSITYDEANPDYKDMFEQCRVKAEKLGYTYFGVQHMSECWGSENARETYDKHGCTENCKRDDGYGAGGTWANFVYRIRKDWSECDAYKCVQYKLEVVAQTGPECPSYNKNVQKSDVTRPCPKEEKCVSPAEWEPLGCYKDSSDRAMGHYFGSITYDEANPDYKDMFEQCRVKAEKLGYTYFGVQHMSECWGSENARETYDKHGCTENCKRDDGYGAGGTWANFVYRIRKDWTDCHKDGCVQNQINVVPDNRSNCPSYNKKVEESDITRPCPDNSECISGGAVNGGWSAYSEWSNCDRSCGGGTKERTRTCTNPAPQNDGSDCTGENKETAQCNTQPCEAPVNGGWTAFSGWSTCTKTCGGGVMERTRSCTNPPPSHGGKDCVGVSKVTYACGRRACPVNGGWSDYGDWTRCNRVCGGGKHYRVRSCNNPRPAAGGKGCVGSTIEWGNCNEQPCPVNGGWTAFSGYSTCTKTCGGGVMERTRSCTNPPPAHGGKDCVGVSKVTYACGRRACPVDGGWSDYGDWTRCNRVCGGGKHYRVRSCNNPRPAAGGKGCVGSKIEWGNCNEQPCPRSG